MGFFANDLYLILVIILVALIISTLAIVVYDSSFTPSKQQDDIDIINSYLRQLIVGYPL